MERDEADFTLVFRHLANGEEEFLKQFKKESSARSWWKHWQEESPDHELLRQTNPIFIPRNHRIAEVIAAAEKGDFSLFHRLHAILSRPFDEQAENAEFERSPEPAQIVQNTFCGT